MRYNPTVETERANRLATARRRDSGPVSKEEITKQQSETDELREEGIFPRSRKIEEQ